MKKKTVKKVDKQKTNNGPWQVGKNYFIRTVTYHTLGRLVSVGQQELELEDASWVSDSGRWNEALSRGTLSEVEPYPPGRMIVGRNAVVDACIWLHELPREVG